MTRQNQKAEERVILDRYLRIRRMTGDVSDGPEPPDFLIIINGQKFGYEITQFHTTLPTNSGHTRRQVEAAWENLRNCEANSAEHLDELNVVLNFSELSVPSGKRKSREFITQVRKMLAGVSASTVSTELMINSGSPKILREFLHSIYVEKVDCWMEWDWNHSVARVGTSENELLDVIGKKIKEYLRAKNDDQHRLIISGLSRHCLIIGGFLSNLSEFAAVISAEQLNGYIQLNQALSNGPFDVVAILDIKNFVWARPGPWFQIQAQNSRP